MGSRGVVSICAVLVAGLAGIAMAADSKPNKPPIGSLDVPAAGAKVTGKTQSYGWALDEDGKITRLELLLDGKSLKTLTSNTARPDVCATSKAAACPKAGFMTKVDFSKVKKGPHTLSLKVTDDHGAKVEIGKRDITVE